MSTQLFDHRVQSAAAPLPNATVGPKFEPNLKSATTGAPALPTRIVRRDGVDVPFEAERIASALARAGAASGEFDADEARLLTARVLKFVRHRYGSSAPTIEQVQDIVEQTLVDANHLATFRATSPTATSTAACARIARRWSMSPPPSTSMSTAPTGACAPTPTRVIRWAG
jgi:hypothetical protein